MDKPKFLEDYREKTKNMSLKEKLIDYIWEYYKGHIIVTLLVLTFIGTYIHDSFINPPNLPYVGIAFYSNSYVPTEVFDKMSVDLNEKLVDPESSYEVFPYDFFVNQQDPTMASAQIQRFMGMITSREIDVAIVESEDFQGLINMESFIPLDTFFSGSDLEMYKDYFILSNLGLDLQKYSPQYLIDAGYDVTNKVLGVISNTERTDEALEVIKIMLQP